MPFHERRTLILALCFSLAVHAALLLGVVIVHRPQTGAPAAAMNVVIQPKGPAPRQPTPPRVSREIAPPLASRAEARKAATLTAERAVRSIRSVRHVEPEQTPERIAVREPSPLVASAAPVAASASDTDAASEAPAPVAQSTPVSMSAGGSAGQVSATEVNAGVSADDLRQYRVSLASAARRFRRYPALARERGLEGTVEVAVRFTSALPAPDVVVVRSSGHDLLDEQAQRMMAQAARTTTLPEGLRGRDLEIPLPIKFSLDEAR